MTPDPKKLSAVAAVMAIALAGSVSMAVSMVGPREAAPLARTSVFPQVPAGADRPMDDVGPDVSWGDLSVFDSISEIGAEQSPDVPYCDHRRALLDTLDHDFAEKQRVITPLEQNRSVELWASDIMGTWTAVYTRADGVACVISSGVGWEKGDNPVALLKSEGLLPA